MDAEGASTAEPKTGGAVCIPRGPSATGDPKAGEEEQEDLEQGEEVASEEGEEDRMEGPVRSVGMGSISEADTRLMRGPTELPLVMKGSGSRRGEVSEEAFEKKIRLCSFRLAMAEDLAEEAAEVTLAVASRATEVRLAEAEEDLGEDSTEVEEEREDEASHFSATVGGARARSLLLPRPIQASSAW